MPVVRRPAYYMILAAAVLAALQSHTEFPGVRPSTSPNHRYVISWTEPTGASPEHSLFIADRRTHTRRLLYSFNRHVAVLWSPDSALIAITDSGGSDYAEVFVASPHSGSPQPVRLPPTIQTAVAPHGHVYVRAVRWLSPSRLLLAVDAYDSRIAPPLKKRFSVSIPSMTRHSSN